jgi:hypothetical protein
MALTAAAGPHKVVRNTAELDFRYEWPSEAVAIPALDLKFYTDAKRQLVEAQESAPEDKKQYQEQGRGSVRDSYWAKWTTTGQSSRLLSLRYESEEYTGGAHPNQNVSDLLWDRDLGREIKFANLFEVADGYPPALQSTYCHKFEREKVKRTGDPIDREVFTCPKLSELASLLIDKNKNGHFEAIDFAAPPYALGSYAEGEYNIVVPVTAQLIASFKPEYRSSFEVHRLQ